MSIALRLDNVARRSGCDHQVGLPATQCSPQVTTLLPAAHPTRHATPLSGPHMLFSTPPHTSPLSYSLLPAFQLQMLKMVQGKGAKRFPGGVELSSKA